ncbi:MAG TPA: hypothetical protein VM870_07950 [Pyrinomonadaceae bacterium]|nr:hypothetical protein [Pyrinomonadaceae bacterium]
MWGTTALYSGQHTQGSVKATCELVVTPIKVWKKAPTRPVIV